MTDLQPLIATVDIVLFALKEGQLSLVLVRRKFPPYKGRLSLPGGYIHVGEDDDAAATARRVLSEKAGIVSPYLEQLYTFSGAKRDPRGYSITICYYALVTEDVLKSGDSEKFVLVPVSDIPQLPFDHNNIVDLALSRLRGKSTYSTLPALLLPPLFTLKELHSVYEQVLDTALDKATFRRKVEAQKIVVETKKMTSGDRHRPATLYKLADRNLTTFDEKILPNS